MKLVLYNNYRLGILRDDRVLDVSSAVADLKMSNRTRLMPAVIAQWDKLRGPIERASQGLTGVPLSSVRLRAPDPRPPKLLACFGNYKEFTQRERLPQDMFLKSPESVIGDGDTVELPPHQATIFHHEAELGVVIGRRSKDLPPTREALDAVFGYTCFVDVSGRGLGRPGQASRMGKSFDTFGPMGPCILTADEVPDPNKLQVRLWVNGELRQDYNTDDMEYTVPEVLAFASHYMTLVPGDFICCGTNHQGLGPLQDGDRAEMEIQGIGRFRFSVQDSLKRTWAREIDREMAQRVRGG
ncbi:MAG: fumarylacetoacetate hydrolase family protein [Chloroflexi bacterium]|nr:fumarylacetoacetate hydrolase family protein [Chloroflexota bacterium]